LAHTLEPITNWAINLATNTQTRRTRNHRFRARNTPLSSPEERRPEGQGPIPRQSEEQRPVPTSQRTTPRHPRINQATPSEPVYPSIQEVPVARQHSTSSNEAQFLETQPRQFHCHLPKTIFVSEHLPTRTPRELNVFKNHCYIQQQAHPQESLVLELPLTLARDITTSPLNFQNLLWKSKTTLSFYRIFEDYCWIRRQQRLNRPDQAILQPAYQVHYKWDQHGWTVTRLTHHRQ